MYLSETAHRSGTASPTRTGNASDICLDGQNNSFSRGREALNKSCGHKKENQNEISRPLIEVSSGVCLRTVTVSYSRMGAALSTDKPRVQCAGDAGSFSYGSQLAERLGTGPRPHDSLVDFKQRRRQLYALRHIRPEPPEPRDANPGSGTGASDDRCTQRGCGHAGEWRQDPQRSRPAVCRIAHRNHVQREPNEFPSGPRASRPSFCS